MTQTQNHLNIDSFFKAQETINVGTGEIIARSDEFTNYIYRIKKGSCRILYGSLEKKGTLTYDRLLPGDYIGLSNLINTSPCEWISASENCELEVTDIKQFSDALISSTELLESVVLMANPSLGIKSAASFIKQQNFLIKEQDTLLKEIVRQGKLIFADSINKDKSKRENLYVSANEVFNNCGKLLQVDASNIVKKNSRIPALAWSFPKSLLNSRQIQESKLQKVASQADLLSDQKNFSEYESAPDSYSLGLRNYDESKLSERFPEHYSRSKTGANVALIEMITKRFNVALRRDSIKRIFQTLRKANRELDSNAIAKLCIATGLEARPAQVDVQNIHKVITPFIALLNGKTIVVHAIEGSQVIYGDGQSPLQKLSLRRLFSEEKEVNFVQVKPRTNSAKDRFNWGWVWGIVKDYKWSLLLVVVISLMAQLFALGTPLLIQQLIDKVLSQGNVSSLNVLAGLMVSFALFQSILTALRTFLFVDTTDRIDLTLGSSIIDRLIRLPLGFFERRPVGELSQRIGEMNTIRGFLTGTAITTFLDLIFSSIYLVIMLTYSPGLTAVALSTFPLYLGITFFAAPIYKHQLRKRAIAQAATQAHLIETLSGIQTVKAQHGELSARWKWQKRYQQFVEQGYKSVILGTTTGQIGSFLNTLSGLLILWFGLRMVLAGEFTLGQLLAFRIFAGYVTQPLLRISNLWQGLQKVNLSMERLADIVNQDTEAGEFDDEKIALAPIHGKVEIENLKFSFDSSNNLQLDNVSLVVNPGEFIGVVGLSGSGKSTLMKMIGRLYPPQSGRILIDDTDISKVQLSSLRSQIGIVPQDSILFEGSVSENIALNDPNIDQESIIQAAKSACAHDFIMELPQGYATRVSEKGANFSGGQRQRLAIARMLIQEPSMLIMDEATSALDADTERKVSRNLMNQLESKTVFFVTHRIATIMGADRIIVMDKGRLIELGTPQELIDKGGIFAALWQQQR